MRQLARQALARLSGRPGELPFQLLAPSLRLGGRRAQRGAELRAAGFRLGEQLVERREELLEVGLLPPLGPPLGRLQPFGQRGQALLLHLLGAAFQAVEISPEVLHALL